MMKGNRIFRITALMFFIGTAGHLSGQSTRPLLRGKITDTNNQAVIQAHILAQPSGYGSVSDSTGHFVLPHDNKFPMTLRISALGYHRRELVLQQAPDGSLQVKLEEDSRSIQQVDVRARRLGSTHNQRLDAAHLQNLPSAGGHGIEGIVRSQMGVAANNELSSQYRVRGGNFDENLVYVNGQEVYRPFLLHSGQQEGLSFVNPDLTEAVEFSAGGFSAAYGDKMSSVLDIQYKRPQESAGSASLGILGANAHLEGAALQQRLTWITGARYKTNRYLLGTLDEKGSYRPDFSDIQAYLTYQASPRLHFEVLAYYSLNSYAFEPEDRETSFGTIQDIKQLRIYFAGKEEDRFQTGYGSFSTHFQLSPQQSYRLTYTGFRTFEEETYDIAGAYWLREVQDPNNEDANDLIGVGEYLQHARNDLLGIVNALQLEGKHSTRRSTSAWGLQYRNEVFKNRVNEWEMIDSAGYSIPYTGSNIQLAYTKNAQHNLANHRILAYFHNQSSWALGQGQLLLDAGLRASYFSFNEDFTLSPRLLLSYLPTQGHRRYRLSGGYYHQPPFFKEMRRPDGSLNKAVKAQRSIHVVAGYDYYFERWERPFKFTTEVYYKHMDRLIPYQVNNVRIVYSGENEAKGYAAGIDFKINGELVPGEESWATLSFLKTEEDLLNDQWSDPERAGEPGYTPRPSDQRVNFSLFFQDYLPNNPDFKVHLSFLYGSGLPFGAPRAPRYQATLRMPPYRRVDLGFSYDLMSRWAQPRAWGLKNMWLGLEVFNLPNISNTISYYWVTDINNGQFAVPNYLTARRINLKLSVKF